MKSRFFIGHYNYTVIATYTALVFGVCGIYSAISGNAFSAVIFLMLAGALDMVDGRIAKTKDRTEDEKHFGIQIDSLCDLVSFGVLPTVIGRSLGLTQLGFTALFALYILTAQIRLAYFNVDEFNRQKMTDGKRKYYKGLPVTSAAVIFPFVYTFLLPMGKQYLSVTYAAVLLLCAVLFVSNINIPKPGKKMIILFALIGIAMIAVLSYYKISGYIVR